MSDFFLSSTGGHCTFLVVLHTYNCVALGWNTTVTTSTGAVHKVAYVTLEGEGVREGVTDCDS